MLDGTANEGSCAPARVIGGNNPCDKNVFFSGKEFHRILKTKNTHKSKKIALDLPAEIIHRNPQQYQNSNIFVGCDSQSSLVAGSLRDFRHSPTGYNWFHTYKSYVDVASELHSTIHLQWLPACVGIVPNEEVDDVAHDYSQCFPDSVQNQQPIELKAIKSTLKRCIKQEWKQNTPLYGAHFNVCGLWQSQLKK